MAKYHKYVFDTGERKFVGAFEEMYQNESKENFDSWHQDDIRQIHRQVSLALLQNYNFQKIVDFGCGKGAFTHLLKKANNEVIGLDISTTAVSIAKEKFPDIDFEAMNLGDIQSLNSFLKSESEKRKTDLIFCAEMFSYLENWKEIIALTANYTKYFFTTLMIPENPIGFVKTPFDFITAIEEHYEIIEVVQLRNSKFNIVFGKSKKHGI